MNLTIVKNTGPSGQQFCYCKYIYVIICLTNNVSVLIKNTQAQTQNNVCTWACNFIKLFRMWELWKCSCKQNYFSPQLGGNSHISLQAIAYALCFFSYLTLSEISASQ